jgi:hypothetical protein
MRSPIAAWLAVASVLGLSACDQPLQRLTGDDQQFFDALSHSSSIADACAELDGLCQKQGKGCSAFRLFCSPSTQNDWLCSKLESACKAGYQSACPAYAQRCAPPVAPPGVDAAPPTPPAPGHEAGVQPPPAGKKDGAAAKPDSGVTPPPPASAGWLTVQGTKILRSDGSLFKGRGANIADTRGCNACTWGAPNVAEVKRRVDELVSWGANFMRLTLESYGSAGGRVHWQTVLQDPAYLADIQTIVAHIGTKPGVYVLLSLWVDPSFDANGWPTTQTQQEWKKLADVFHNSPHVLFGLVNEPQNNFDGSLDAGCWKAMNDTVAAIRAVEDSYKTPHHVITVQGTGGWARRLDYYFTHPITAGGGDNIAYEVHVYDPASSFNNMVVVPAGKIPIVIGEFGPASGSMTQADATQLAGLARQYNVPHLAWMFHMRCSPDLLVDNSGGGCGVGMALQPTAWGSALKGELSKPW